MSFRSATKRTRDANLSPVVFELSPRSGLPLVDRPYRANRERPSDAFRLYVFVTAVAFVGLVGAGSALAASYDDLIGARGLTYRNIADEAGSFGPPVVSESGLAWTASSLATSCIWPCGQVPYVEVEDRLGWIVDSSGGQGLSRLDLSLAGRAGAETPLTPGSGLAFSQVTALSSVRIDILEVDYRPIEPVRWAADLVFDSPGSTGAAPAYVFSAPAGPGVEEQWAAGGAFDLNSILRANGLSGIATQVAITLDVQLVAIALLRRGSASIELDAVSVDYTVVPEPATLLLLATGMALLASGRSDVRIARCRRR